ncbi:MAG: hypothetical protein J0H55_16525 [Chitinophagaceae bacterium]|nr:hypothetical protein [Chitinophagaceae bacterium]
MTAVTSTTTSQSPAQTVKAQHKKKTKAEKAEVKSTASTTPHMKKDGTPDKRFKANKHLKKNGTPDKRFKENKKKS